MIIGHRGKDGTPFPPTVLSASSLLLNHPNLGHHGIHRGGHELMHDGGIRSLDDVGLVPIAEEKTL